MIDITVYIVFHSEGVLAIPALSSMHRLVEVAKIAGLSVESKALMDNPDTQTSAIIEKRGNWLDSVEILSYGDLGLTRNAGVTLAKGTYITFLDGDDLWGSQWLVLAHAAAIQEPANAKSIWHPESLFYFYYDDFDRHSINRIPHSHAKSFHFFHKGSDTPNFDRNVLFLDNLWSANCFAHREIYEKYTYKAVDKSLGLGIEDWAWNIKTLWDGVEHKVCHDTVHIIRQKDTGSLGQSNTANGLLPHLPDNIFPVVGK